MDSRKDEYRTYLQTEQWAEIRATIYSDADGLCVICQAPAVAVHHRHYAENFKDDTADGKLAVCGRCHRAFHGIHEHTPRQRGENTAARAMADFVVDTGVPLDKAMQYTNRILLIMARYYAEVGK